MRFFAKFILVLAMVGMVAFVVERGLVTGVWIAVLFFAAIISGGLYLGVHLREQAKEAEARKGVKNGK